MPFLDPTEIANVGGSTLVLKKVAVAFIPLTAIALSLRMYVRVRIVKGFGLDDVLLLIGEVSVQDFGSVSS